MRIHVNLFTLVDIIYEFETWCISNALRNLHCRIDAWLSTWTKWAQMEGKLYEFVDEILIKIRILHINFLHKMLTMGLETWLDRKRQFPSRFSSVPNIWTNCQEDSNPLQRNSWHLLWNSYQLWSGSQIPASHPLPRGWSDLLKFWTVRSHQYRTQSLRFSRFFFEM